MHTPPHTPPRPIRPDDFEVMAQIPGIACIARDQDLRLFWSTEEFFRVPRVVDSALDMMGTRLSEILPKSAARERELIHRQVMETGRSTSYYQLSSDTRVLCTIMPLDERAFSHRGVFAMMKDARMDPRTIPKREIPCLSTPVFGILETLSPRELEILHSVAIGLSTHEIASKINRADKTIEHHINSIHSKLDTHSRAQLVRYTSERGIQAFSDTEWASIVRGAKQIHRELDHAS